MRKVVLVDDHALLRSGLAGIVADLGYQVLYECDNGRQLVNEIDTREKPDLVLMDINMPEMNGFETTLWLKKNHPLINVIALSMRDDERSIIKMLRNGAQGYILKDIKPSELKTAIEAVATTGYHYSEHVTGSLIHAAKLSADTDVFKEYNLKPKDIHFLKLICTEMTYKEIAEHMNLSPRTIDGYRDELFAELGLKSRVGLVLFAIRNGIAQIE
jgi:two-component system, NarL family, invasion response regulator UvrY